MDAKHEFEKALQSFDCDKIYDQCVAISQKIFGYSNDETTLSVLCYILEALDIDYKFITLYDWYKDDAIRKLIDNVRLFDDRDLYPEIVKIFDEMQSILKDY